MGWGGRKSAIPWIIHNSYIVIVYDFIAEQHAQHTLLYVLSQMYKQLQNIPLVQWQELAEQIHTYNDYRLSLSLPPPPPPPYTHTYLSQKENTLLVVQKDAVDDFNHYIISCSNINTLMRACAHAHTHITQPVQIKARNITKTSKAEIRQEPVEADTNGGSSNKR